VLPRGLVPLSQLSQVQGYSEHTGQQCGVDITIVSGSKSSGSFLSPKIRRSATYDRFTQINAESGAAC